MAASASRSIALRSAELTGLEAPLLEVEVHASHGLPRVDIVGLADPCVRESKQRVRAAIVASGMRFPESKITINLAPASIKKMGTGLDLPMALGILLACEKVKVRENLALGQILFVGELSLSGGLRPVQGMLNVAIMARAAAFQSLIVPVESVREAALISGIEIIGANSLMEVIQHVEGSRPLPVVRGSPELSSPLPQEDRMDLAQIRGQSLAKEAILIAAAGGHNVILVGPPGAGKTLMAQTLPTILPDLDEEESIETTRIYSCAGLLSGAQPMRKRAPFRSPHHSVSDAGLIGGTQALLPGELSLAHHGVLFLDELPEFRRNVLEMLREPLESGQITLSRANGSVSYPARFQLVAAMNPCPCGYAGSETGLCTCSQQEIRKYTKRISGPLLDRIDLRVFLQPVPSQIFLKEKSVSPSVDVECPLLSSKMAKHLVERVRQRQRLRFQQQAFKKNAYIPANQVEYYCALDGQAKKVLLRVLENRIMTGRGIHRLLRVARTIADLRGEMSGQTWNEIPEQAMLEALNFWQAPRILLDWLPQ